MLLPFITITKAAILLHDHPVCIHICIYALDMIMNVVTLHDVNTIHDDLTKAINEPCTTLLKHDPQNDFIDVYIFSMLFAIPIS